MLDLLKTYKTTKKDACDTLKIKQFSWSTHTYGFGNYVCKEREYDCQKHHKTNAC
jgi:hypothetical protein